MLFNACYKNKKVLVTGHTGFKGGWLCAWLSMLGAKVYGYALPMETRTLYAETFKESADNEWLSIDSSIKVHKHGSAPQGGKKQSIGRSKGG